MKKAAIFTDGACLVNPGPGGWGAVLRLQQGDKIEERELGGGYALTTNNRMEIWAAISALEALEEPCEVTLTTDSQYLKQAVEKWMKKWMKNGWQTSALKSVKNQDLWMRLHEQLRRHRVTFAWVRGHTGNAENERCDAIAKEWSERKDLPDDTGYTPLKSPAGSVGSLLKYIKMNAKKY